MQDHFIGRFSPEAMGDYIAGPIMYQLRDQQNFPRLSVNDFLKRYFAKITKSGIERLGPSVINLENMKI